ncbi:MAG: RNA polymerase factor sigma-54 [Planctomycetes bacterium]|nr:RNA polymerase factor sigma-54 [Planctomycetota bacterium]MCP4771611.1 RNA polymerase factor sigma-54 [Planctomycetota bacterium]MCP4860089.1 RNA polymerase factor sigma-54 [Planctomycetota bacterium]
MRLEYNQNLKLEQRLAQSPQMIQAMQILQLTMPELLDRIAAELEDNPFLETSDSADKAQAEDQESNDPPEEDHQPDPVDLDNLGNLLEGAPSRSPSSPNEENDYDMVQNVAAPEVHTEDSILAEMRMREEPADVIRNAELIFRFLDPRGFLPHGLEEVAEVTGVDFDKLHLALSRIRTIAHPAIGCEDLRECFLLQMDAMEDDHYVARKILVDYFDDLLSNRIPQIAKAEDLTLDEVRHAIEVLALFDSRPLGDYEQDYNRTIFPDVVIEEDDQGEMAIRLVRDGMPEVRLTRKAQEALEQAKGDKRLHAFLMKKIERARWFLDAVQQRRETLTKISEELVKRQREFLAHGPERMQTLKMQEVADAVGVHISTVSRAIRGKHAQTPQGILPLKGFFSGGQSTAKGGHRSRVAIQERIKEIVGAEDKAHPLSDEEIVRVLRDRDGTKVARRTVTKYRQAMEIPSSTMRRAY